MTNIQKKDESGPLRFLLGLFKSLVAGLIAAALLAVLLSAVALGFDDANSVMTPFAYAALFGGAIACGILSRRRGLLLPIAAGCAYCVTLWLISLPVGGDGESVGALGTLFCYLACTAVSFVSGTVGTAKKSFRSEGKNSPTVQLRRRIGRR